MKLNLNEIVIDKDTQSRDAISEDVVHEYSEAMENGDKFPPIIVFFDGMYYYLVDGYHRYFSYLKLGVSEVDVVIHKGTRRDAEVFSWGVNDKHGQPRSATTKRYIVMKALDNLEYQDKSDRELSKILKLSHSFISNMRHELSKPKANVKPLPRVPNKPIDPLPPVETFKPVEQMGNDEEDQISELAALNQELHEENEKYKTKEMILEGDSAKVEETITDLRKQLSIMEMELRSAKNSRDQYMAKNSELIKSVNYWKKKYEKLAKIE